MLPVALSTRFRISYDSRSPAPLAQFDPLTVDEILDAADRSGGKSVLWIGDSIVWSGSQFGITGPQMLEIELQRLYGPSIHVFNAALPAARTADKYAILLQVLARNPALVIYESKYLEFSRAQVETVTFRYPYLNDFVASDPEYAKVYGNFPHTRPPLVAPRSQFEIQTEHALYRWLSIVRYRALLQQIAFGGDLFARLSGAPPSAGPVASVNDGVARPTGQAGVRVPNPVARLPENFSGAYRSGPFEAFANAGLFFGRRAAAALDATQVPRVVYTAALNHALLGALGSDDLFQSNMAIVDDLFSGHQFPYSNYHLSLSEDGNFLDTEHLSATGHLAMARMLISDHREVFDRALAGSN
jgi:hypothetical protein